MFILTWLIYNYYKYIKKSKEKTIKSERDEIKEIINEYQISKRDFGVIVISVENIFEIFNLFGYQNIEPILDNINKYFSSFSALKFVYTNNYIFSFVLPDYSKNRIEKIIKKITRITYKKPLIIDGVFIYLNINLGWALSNEGNTEEILKKGFSRMKCLQKKDNEDSVFDAGKIDITMLISEFKNSLKQEEFYLVYQPKFDLKNNKLSGVEALIRWKHAKLGEILPLDFIPYLEKTHFINELTFWILQSVIQDLKEWNKKGINLKISINICPRNILDEDFIKKMNLIVKINMPYTKNIIFEITETDLMINIDKAREVLSNFKKDKIDIHIDDFGTGYSSLAYLKELPIDCLKIDRSFIRNLDSSNENKEIVKTIVQMAHNLEKRVIAEGVESLEVSNWLKEINCDEIQGYYLSRPLKKIDLEKFISEKKYFDLLK